MTTKDILLIVLPIVTGLGSSYLTYYLTSKSKKDEAILRFKEEKYGNLLLLLQGFFIGATAKPKDVKRSFFEEQYKSWLYSSDDVVKAINNMIVELQKSAKSGTISDGDEVVGKIVLAMRRDMLGKTKLSAKDFKYAGQLD